MSKDSLKQTIKITEEEANDLQKLNERKVAIEAFVQQVIDEGQNKLQELQKHHQSTWLLLAKKYGFDVEKEAWTGNWDEKELKCVQLKL